MLTIEERMNMYKGKKLFIDAISKVFEDPTLYSNVIKIEYEVYSKQFNDDTFYTEFVIVTFVSSAKSVRNVSGTSNNGIFAELGELINGGYYEEVHYYESVVACSDKIEL